MSKDITTSGPSRRSIAKGAAWAVPAVSVAAAAPALAASPIAVCAPGTLVVTANCPPVIQLPTADAQQLTFTVSNPAGSGCIVPTDTTFTVDRGGLAGVFVTPLNDLNASVGVLFDTATTGHLTAPLAEGQSVTIQVFPRNLANVAVAQDATFTIDGSSATQAYTIISATLPVLGTTSVALCA